MLLLWGQLESTGQVSVTPLVPGESGPGRWGAGWIPARTPESARSKKEQQPPVRNKKPLLNFQRPAESPTGPFLGLPAPLAGGCAFAPVEGRGGALPGKQPEEAPEGEGPGFRQQGVCVSITPAPALLVGEL